MIGFGTLVVVLTGSIALAYGASHDPGWPRALYRIYEDRADLTSCLRGRGGRIGEFDKSNWDFTRSESGARFAPGEIIVMFKEGVDEATIARLNSELGARVLSTSPYLGFKRLGIPADKTIMEMVDVYNQDPRVQYAEPNAIVHASYTPNDPYFSYQWHFLNIGMQSAWDIQQAQSSVVVGILDTGIAYENSPIPAWETGEVLSSDGMYHRAPDLATTVFVPGYDFVHGETHPNDQNSHGTHVAGTVAQSTNNMVGIAGMAFGASIMPVQVLGYIGSGFASTIANGIIFAKDNGADVINMSLGGAPGDSMGMTTVHLAMIQAWNAGITICCATANHGASQISYPAGFDECIAVGAVRFDSTRSYYSNYGTGIDVVAPGGDVTVDQNGDGYADGVLQETYTDVYDRGGGGELAWVDDFTLWFWQGTSMATPHVAALAALLISKGLTDPNSIKSVIEATATDRGAPGYDLEYGWGLINPVDALNSVGIVERGGTSRHDEVGTALFQNTPNPFSSSTTVRYALSVPGRVTLEVYDGAGQLATTLLDVEMPAGTHSVNWNGEDLSTGVYFLKLKSGGQSYAQKAVILR